MLAGLFLVPLLFSFPCIAWDTAVVAQTYDPSFWSYQGGNCNRTNSQWATLEYETTPTSQMIRDSGIGSLYSATLINNGIDDDLYALFDGRQLVGYKPDMSLKWSSYVSGPVHGMVLSPSYNNIVLFTYLSCNSLKPNSADILLTSYLLDSGSSDILDIFDRDGDYLNCDCCDGAVADSAGNFYFSSTEYIISYDGSGIERWTNQIIPMPFTGSPKFKRQFILTKEENTVFIQDIDEDTYTSSGTFQNQMMAYNARTGATIWYTGVHVSGILATATPSSLFLATSSEISAISVSTGQITTLLCTITDIHEIPQVLVSTDSSSLFVVNSQSAYSFSITETSCTPQWSISSGHDLFERAALVNDNSLYIARNSGSISSFSASTGAAKWETESFDSSPTQLIVSVTGSIYTTYNEDYTWNILKYQGDTQLSITIFSIVLFLFYVFCFLLCCVATVIFIIPVDNKLRRLAKSYLKRISPIELIAMIPKRRTTKQCVCVFGMIPAMAHLYPLEFAIVQLYSLLAQLLISATITGYTTARCSGDNVDVILNCNWPPFIQLIITSTLVVIIVVPIRGILASCTPAVFKALWIRILGGLFILATFIGTIAIAINMWDQILGVLSSWLFSIFLDWFTGPVVGLLCCNNCFCCANSCSLVANRAYDEYEAIL